MTASINSDKSIEKDKARMLHAKATGQPIIVTKWWPGVEQWLYDEMMLVPGKDVFVPDPKMTKEQVMVERTRWRNRKKYQEQREQIGLKYRERGNGGRVSEKLADSALRQVSAAEQLTPSPSAPTAADKLAGVVLSGVKPDVRTDTRTVTPRVEPTSHNKLSNFRLKK